MQTLMQLLRSLVRCLDTVDSLVIALHRARARPYIITTMKVLAQDEFLDAVSR